MSVAEGAQVADRVSAGSGVNAGVAGIARSPAAVQPSANSRRVALREVFLSVEALRSPMMSAHGSS